MLGSFFKYIIAALVSIVVVSSIYAGLYKELRRREGKKVAFSKVVESWLHCSPSRGLLFIMTLGLAVVTVVVSYVLRLAIAFLQESLGVVYREDLSTRMLYLFTLITALHFIVLTFLNTLSRILHSKSSVRDTVNKISYYRYFHILYIIPGIFIAEYMLLLVNYLFLSMNYDSIDKVFSSAMSGLENTMTSSLGGLGGAAVFMAVGKTFIVTKIKIESILVVPLWGLLAGRTFRKKHLIEKRLKNLLAVLSVIAANTFILYVIVVKTILYGQVNTMALVFYTASSFILTVSMVLLLFFLLIYRDYTAKTSRATIYPVFALLVVLLGLSTLFHMILVQPIQPVQSPTRLIEFLEKIFSYLR
ncbi:hypothetical protein J4526_07505 [Desulfurococcaceae archaeon MEX13E-LK6-19]|nr:hypothetical protein J4526_07505 [Desulfurococcaceae archaeon MEX13E-LK6-19]